MTSRPLGLLLLVVAAAMAICAGLGHLALESEGWDPAQTKEGAAHLLTSAGITACAGIISLLASWKVPFKIGRREALFVVSTIWIAMGVFGGIPYVIGADLSVVDALFEAFSGVTTTGGTILTEIERSLSAPIHLWRIASQWLGGLGIVVLFVALLPSLGVGGKRLFQSEAAGPQTEGISPRIRDTAKALWWIYLSITMVALLALKLAGMPWFDALTQALSTLGTGGFAIKNGSIGEYGSVPVEAIITVFMLIGGTNFALFHAAKTGGMKVFWKSQEFRVYALLFVGITAIIAADLRMRMVDSGFDAIRYAGFQVAAIMTSTGFGTADYEEWSTLSQLLLVTLYFCGGMAGSTAGGMKLIRILIIGKVVVHEVRMGFQPSMVAPIRVGQQPVAEPVVRATLAYALIFLITVLLGAISVATLDPFIDLTTALIASLACVANVGPGLAAVGPTDNYAFFSDGSKLVLSVCMLLGRLEFFSLLALLTPGFWRR